MICDHSKKVYDNNILLSYPTKRKWLCTLCGENGIETEDTYISNEYNEWIKTWEAKNCKYFHNASCCGQKMSPRCYGKCENYKEEI